AFHARHDPSIPLRKNERAVPLRKNERAVAALNAVGDQVTNCRPGDEVFASSNHTLAEFVSVPDDKVTSKPGNLTFPEAAAVPTAAVTALQGLRDAGKLQAGQKVLINGASGGVGTFAVQIAKAFGAHVTGVCSTRKLAMVRSLGADDVIDYTREDFTRGERRYDLILDNVANHSFSDLRRALAPEGLIVLNSGHAGMGYVLKAVAPAPFSRRLAGMYLASPNKEELGYLKGLIEGGKLRPVIDRTYPLDQTADAFRYLEESHAQGKVVITIAGGDET
ncbi:MAG: NAD(P)-dependent alcohol dehydrogenase, partial [Spirochaetota bacterium]